MTKAQKYYEKVLNIGVIILLAWHMIMTIGKIFFSAYKAEMIYAGVLFLLSFIYIVLCRVRWKGTQNRISLITSRIRTKNQCLCIVFFVWYVISLLINKGPRVKDNFWLLYDVGINCFLLFSLPAILPKEKGKKTIDFLLHVISLAGLCYVIYGLWHLFTLNYVYLDSGEFIGMTAKHNFELGAYYNSTAAFALSFILLSLYMTATQNVLIKVFYILTLIPHTLTLILTNSRTAFGACIAAYFCFIFLVIWNNLQQKTIMIRLICAIIASAAAAAAIWMLRPLGFQFFESVTQFSTEKMNAVAMLHKGPVGYDEITAGNRIGRCMIFFSIPVLITKEKFTVLSKFVHHSINRAVKISLAAALIFVLFTFSIVVSPDTSDTAFVFNHNIVHADVIVPDAVQSPSYTGAESVRDFGDFTTIKSREEIWKDSIKIMTSDWKTFLFGVTPLGFDDAIKRVTGKNTRVYHAHNEVLNMGVSLGVPMMLALLVLYISIGIKSIRLCFLNKKQSFPGVYVLPIVFITFFISTLLEAYLFASFTIMSSLFFLFCGWINALDMNRSTDGLDN